MGIAHPTYFECDCLDDNSLKNIGYLDIMKHSQWIRRQKEGEQIVTALRALGYRCFQPTPSLFWTVRQEEIFYRLTWLSSPLNEWSLLPNDGTKELERLLAKILAVVKQYREQEVPLEETLPPAAGGSSRAEVLPLPDSGEQQRRQLEDNYPWSIIQLLPNAQRKLPKIQFKLISPDFSLPTEILCHFQIHQLI